MNKNRLFDKWYMKYIVKSTKIYYFCLILFIFSFFIIAQIIKVDIREEYPAIIEKNKVSVCKKEAISFKDKKIYLYEDKSKTVIVDTIKDYQIINNKQYIYIRKNQKRLSGNIKIEVVTGKQALLKRIFVQAGKSS